jgi:hypothetical protein
MVMWKRQALKGLALYPCLKFQEVLAFILIKVAKQQRSIHTVRILTVVSTISWSTELIECFFADFMVLHDSWVPPSHELCGDRTDWTWFPRGMRNMDFPECNGYELWCAGALSPQMSCLWRNTCGIVLKMDEGWFGVGLCGSPGTFHLFMVGWWSIHCPFGSSTTSATKSKWIFISD